MKNVLLLGDSIRMQYEPEVRKLLAGKAEICAPEENGRWSGYTLNSLQFWLPSLPVPDIVHWNCGLWDIGDDYELGRPFSLPEEYVSAIERTIAVLKKRCGDNIKIILATTTPTGEQDKKDPREYNGLIAQVAEKYALEVNDLYTTIAGDVHANIRGDKIHLTERGTHLAACQVAECIEKYLD